MLHVLDHAVPMLQCRITNALHGSTDTLTVLLSINHWLIFKLFYGLFIFIWSIHKSLKKKLEFCNNSKSDVQKYLSTPRHTKRFKFDEKLLSLLDKLTIKFPQFQ